MIWRVVLEAMVEADEQWEADARASGLVASLPVVARVVSVEQKMILPGTWAPASHPRPH